MSLKGTWHKSLDILKVDGKGKSRRKCEDTLGTELGVKTEKGLEWKENTAMAAWKIWAPRAGTFFFGPCPRGPCEGGHVENILRVKLWVTETSDSAGECWGVSRFPLKNIGCALLLLHHFPEPLAAHTTLSKLLILAMKSLDESSPAQYYFSLFLRINPGWSTHCLPEFPFVSTCVPLLVIFPLPRIFLLSVSSIH